MLQKSLCETTFEATASRFEFSSEFRMKSRSNKVGEGVTCRIGIRCPPARERSERAVEIGFSVPGKGFSPLPLHPPWQGNGGRGRACVWDKMSWRGNGGLSHQEHLAPPAAPKAPRHSHPIREICNIKYKFCLLYTSPSPRDGLLSRMPSSA